MVTEGSAQARSTVTVEGVPDDVCCIAKNEPAEPNRRRRTSKKEPKPYVEDKANAYALVQAEDQGKETTEHDRTRQLVQTWAVPS